MKTEGISYSIGTDGWISFPVKFEDRFRIVDHLNARGISAYVKREREETSVIVLETVATLNKVLSDFNESK